jgi:hypothetical protein
VEADEPQPHHRAQPLFGKCGAKGSLPNKAKTLPQDGLKIKILGPFVTMGLVNGKSGKHKAVTNATQGASVRGGPNQTRHARENQKSVLYHHGADLHLCRCVRA